MVRKLAALLLNIALAVVVLVAWGRMAFRLDDSGVLSAPGLYSLRYYTVLSNLLQAVTSVAYAVCAARVLKRGSVPRGVLLLKYAAAVSVALTFAVVACFLGPLYGYRGMFLGSNFWFHMAVPLGAAFTFCALERDGALPFSWSLWALVPTVLYGLGYAANLAVNGLRANGRSNDWYSFAWGGMKTVPLMFAVILLAAWGIALLLRRAKRKG